MRQSYLKNAVLMTGADVLLRLAGMGLRIYLAQALGGEGMGLYQLVLAVYALFVTLATAGVSVAATRLMAEELSGPRPEARGMLVRLLGAGLGLGTLAWAAQFGLAGLAAQWWLGDARAAGALRVSSVCRGWRSRQCCAAFSSPGGGWSPMCAASWQSRPSASGSFMLRWSRAAPLAGTMGGNVRSFSGPLPSVKLCPLF